MVHVCGWSNNKEGRRRRSEGHTQEGRGTVLRSRTSDTERSQGTKYSDSESGAKRLEEEGFLADGKKAHQSTSFCQN
jgi:hypothetical protein